MFRSDLLNVLCRKMSTFARQIVLAAVRFNFLKTSFWHCYDHIAGVLLIENHHRALVSHTDWR